MGAFIVTATPGSLCHCLPNHVVQLQQTRAATSRVSYHIQCSRLVLVSSGGFGAESYACACPAAFPLTSKRGSRLPSNVRVKRMRHSGKVYYWGHTANVLDGLKALANLRSVIDWRFVVRMHDASYPMHASEYTSSRLLKPNSIIIQLEKWNPHHWLASYNTVVFNCEGWSQVLYMHGFPHKEVELAIPGFKWHRGSEWWGLSKELAEYLILPELDSFYNLTSHRMNVEEVVWASIVASIPGFDQSIEQTRHHMWALWGTSFPSLFWRYAETIHSPVSLYDSNYEEIQSHFEPLVNDRAIGDSFLYVGKVHLPGSEQHIEQLERQILRESRSYSKDVISGQTCNNSGAESVQPSEAGPTNDDVEEMKPASPVLDSKGKREPRAAVHTQIEGCQDTMDRCFQWASEGECAANDPFMVIRCCQSCLKQSQEIRGDTCKDTHAECTAWASHGECANEPFMLHACCHSCVEKVAKEKAVKVKAKQEKVAKEKTVKVEGQQDEAANQEIGDDTCKDTHAECTTWASEGECAANDPFMVIRCCQSCLKHNQEIRGDTCKDTKAECTTGVYV